MLVITYKVSHGKGLDYLWLCLSLSLLTTLELVGWHAAGPISQFHLVGPRGHIFPVTVPMEEHCHREPDGPDPVRLS